jgi:hypothetical protein
MISRLLDRERELAVVEAAWARGDGASVSLEPAIDEEGIDPGCELPWLWLSVHLVSPGDHRVARHAALEGIRRQIGSHLAGVSLAAARLSRCDSPGHVVKLEPHPILERAEEFRRHVYYEISREKLARLRERNAVLLLGDYQAAAGVAEVVMVATELYESALSIARGAGGVWDELYADLCYTLLRCEVAAAAPQQLVDASMVSVVSELPEREQPLEHCTRRLDDSWEPLAQACLCAARIMSSDDEDVVRRDGARLAGVLAASEGMHGRPELIVGARRRVEPAVAPADAERLRAWSARFA